MSGDNYKAKVMRHMLPRPYNQDFGAFIPTMLTVIGQSDNLIGGLFGAADFLPDESPPTLASSIQFIGSVTAFSNPNSPVGDAWSFTLPSTAHPGDVILLIIGTTSLIISPSCHIITAGWSTISTFLGDDLDVVVIGAYRVTGGESSPVVVTFTDDINIAEALPVVLIYRGADLPTPSSVISSVVSSGAGQFNFVCPSQTPARVGDVYIGIPHINANPTSVASTPGNNRFTALGVTNSIAVFDITSTVIIPFGAQVCIAAEAGQEGSTRSFILPLGVIASVPDDGASIIQQVRKSMLVASAVGSSLDAVGNNRGVPRPESTNDDELYRRVIKALAWLPKSILLSYYALLSAVFGTQAEVKIQVGRPWKVYEVNANELIVELPAALIAGSLESATYLHGATGYAFVSTGPTNTFTTNFDLRLSSAVSVVGLAVHVETTPGTWTDYTVSSYSFDAGTGTATVQVSASTLSAGGGRFYLEVPGDGTDSYRGDYLATGGIVARYSTAAGPLTNTLLVVGDLTQMVQPGMTVSISISGVFQTRTTSTLTYSSTTNITTVVITATDVPGGQAGQELVVTQELADTPSTPPHNDRIYLTGAGLYQVVQFYLDLLVRASGIVVRLAVV